MFLWKRQKIVLKNVYDGQKINGLSKSDFRDLLKLTTTVQIFILRVTPLEPALASAFLCHHERKWLRKCPLA